MMERIQLYLSYYYKAQTKYKIHSPFVYDLFMSMTDMVKEFYCFKELEALRKQLLSNTSEIIFEEIGAGSKVFDSTIYKRRVCDIAKASISSKEECRTLFSLVNALRPKKILELGTSLGLATAYMACARPSATILTVEGNITVLDEAFKIWGEMNLQNITPLNAHFDEILPAIMDTHQDIDMAYIDGNHSYKATTNYFENIVPIIAKNKGCMIFDDIHWSKEMNEAWQSIISDKRVIISLELFDLGIVFLEPLAPKQHFTLINYWKKPWQIGLF